MKGMRCVLRVVGVVLVATLLTGCQLGAEKSQRVSDDWSRGVFVGKAALNARVAMALDAGADSIYLAWVAEHDGSQPLHLVKLDRAGRSVFAHDLPVSTSRPSHVELVVGGPDTLYLTWIDRFEGGRALFYTTLNAQGQPSQSVQPISLPGLMVESYALVPRPTQGLDIVWSVREGQGAGLYHTRLDAQGQLVLDNVLIRAQGFDPSAQLDAQGALHLAWQEEAGYGERLVYYGVLAQGRRTLDSTRQMANFPVAMGQIGHRPCLALSARDVYIFWSVERRGGGLSLPSADSHYVSFPQGQPQLAAEPRQVVVPAHKDAQMDRVTTPLRVQELGRVGAADRPSEFVYLPAASPAGQDWVAAAFAVQISSRTKSIVQIALTYWEGGALQGYQIASETRSASLRPALASDSKMDLVLAWIDTAGFGQYDVYWASTAPEAHAYLNRLTGRDVLHAVYTVIWGVGQALSFLPIVFAWVALPLFMIAVYAFISAEGDLARSGPRLTLLGTTALYVVCKFLFRPNWLAALPLPRNIAPELADVAILAAPVIISAIAAVATCIYIKRREYASLFAAFGVFVAVDAILTLLIYVPVILAE